jgi:hypothetical protein
MPDFSPVNSLETKLRALLTDKTTPCWTFYTPLAAAPLWIIVRAHPELDGSDLVAPPGQNPEVCVMRGPKYSCIGVYTAESRVKAAMELWKMLPSDMTYVSAPGYQLLRYIMTFDKVDYMWINAGLKECQYQLDADMVEILLSRPEPEYQTEPSGQLGLHPEGDPQHYLDPLREFLSRQPTVRAAWIFGRQPEPPLPEGQHAYDFGLLMDDPEDRSIEEKVETMLKALTPVEMDWDVTSLMADEQSLRNLAKEQPPFYQGAGFLRAASAK